LPLGPRGDGRRGSPESGDAGGANGQGGVRRGARVRKGSILGLKTGGGGSGEPTRWRRAAAAAGAAAPTKPRLGWGKRRHV
jgi:hypothetical protein